MAGHSKFKNIMHRKGAQDKKRAKVFARIIRELTVAAKDGDEPDSNPKLRLAISNAKASNMPKDTLERAIKRGASGEDAANYEDMRYEGYGPGGVAVIVDVMTDNKNRSAAEVRAAFTRFGGNLGETNSVSFMFDRVGEIIYPQDKATADDMFEAAVDAGADNVESDEETHAITTTVENFTSVREAMIAKFGNPDTSELTWKPQTLTEIADESKAQSLMKMIDMLEESDDVQQVSSNSDIPESILEKLESN